jgi:hypothetical protein
VFIIKGGIAIERNLMNYSTKIIKDDATERNISFFYRRTLIIFSKFLKKILLEKNLPFYLKKILKCVFQIILHDRGEKETLGVGRKTVKYIVSRLLVWALLDPVWFFIKLV